MVASFDYQNENSFGRVIITSTARAKFAFLTGNPNTLSAIKINVLLFTCILVSFESFRGDLNEAKAVSCNVVNYLLSWVNISHLPLCNYDVPITSQVSSNVNY